MSVEREREKIKCFFVFNERTNREERKKKNLISLSVRFLMSKNEWFVLDLRERMAQWRKVTHCRPLLSLCAAAAALFELLDERVADLEAELGREEVHGPRAAAPAAGSGVESHVRSVHDT